MTKKHRGESRGARAPVRYSRKAVSQARSSRKTRSTSRRVSDADDRTLIAFGEQFDKWRPMYDRANARLRPLWERKDKLLQRWCKKSPGYSQQEWWEASCRISSEIGLTALEESADSPSNLLNEIDPCAYAILETPATTLAGVHVKARYAAWAAADLWEEVPNDMDWDRLAMRSLLDAVLAVGGPR